MPEYQAPCVELGSAPEMPSLVASPSPSEISSASSPEPPDIRATPLFRALAMRPPEPVQPQGQEELERRLPGYRRIVIPRELTLIELLKQCSGVTSDEEVLRIREAKLRVVAERVGLRRLHVLAPRLRSLTLDGSAISSLRDLGIGLVHLKILSVNRCGLSTLDGVWGLGALRELYAAGNRIRDLQPLAGLQKLHTLNLADNPISESSRLWTLGVCGALRRLTLTGTAISDAPDYRSSVALALPMLVYLDERPLHTDIEFDLYDDDGAALSSSDSEVEADHPIPTNSALPTPLDDPGPSTSTKDVTDEKSREGNDVESPGNCTKKLRRRRPATTENGGIRPVRPDVPRRPRTAQDRPAVDAPTRLQILNTLIDDEWLSSGSKLTSVDPVCGNLARALRRTSSAYRRMSVGQCSTSTESLLHDDFKINSDSCHYAMKCNLAHTVAHIRNYIHLLDARLVRAEAETELMEHTMENAARALAAEIPRVLRLEDWAKFKEDTGIDIEIDFNARPEPQDPSKAIDRLDQIERETMERFKQEQKSADNISLPNSTFSDYSTSRRYEFWKEETDAFNRENVKMVSINDFDDMRSVSRERIALSGDNNDSRTE